MHPQLESSIHDHNGQLRDEPATKLIGELLSGLNCILRTLIERSQMPLDASATQDLMATHQLKKWDDMEIAFMLILHAVGQPKFSCIMLIVLVYRGQIPPRMVMSWRVGH